MAVDLRQVMAAFLTFSMFLMLGNMIKRDHIDPLLEPYPESTNVQYNSLKVSKAGTFKLAKISDRLWRENNEPMHPCWKKPSLIKEISNQSSYGYIFFSLSHGPEYHASQVSNAVAVARHLDAKLAIPDIRGSKSGEKMKFGDIYDVDTFVRSLKGVVRVDKNPPAELSDVKHPIVRVPDRVSSDFIASKIDPIFRSRRNLKIVTYYNSSRGKDDEQSTTYQCTAMFESLKLQSELQQLVDSMVGTLRSLSHKTRGRYIAVDLRVDMLKRRICQAINGASKRCYNAEEIGGFLRNIGVETETTIYLTQTGWSSSLNGLRNVFPNTFTKDAIMAVDQKAMFMEHEKMVDFHVCVQSDVFVPSFRGRFYSGVVGKRIGEGRTKILVPAENVSSAPTHYVSPYITKRSHFAYSCFC